jgi:importin subunit beta-1
VKPVVLSCFGEIATAITSKFEPYMQISLMLLMQASAADADQADDEMIEYINLLRESIVEAYIGIINGLADGKRLDLMGPYMPSLFQFLHKIASDENRDEALVSKVIGLIGDIAREMGPAVKDMINQPFIASLLQEGIQSQEAEYVNLAQWAFGVVQNVVQS